MGCPGGVSGRRPPALGTHAPAPPPSPPTHASAALRGEAMQLFQWQEAEEEEAADGAAADGAGDSGGAAAAGAKKES